MKRIAIPIVKGKISESFGQCSHYEIFEIDKNQIKKNELEVPHLDDISLLPAWTAQRGITDIIANKVDKRIIKLFTEHKIHLFIGVPQKKPRLLIEDYLNGVLKSDNNVITNIISSK